MPKTNADYWRAKIARNRARDEKTLVALAALGWRTLVVYECELRDAARLRGRLEEALRQAQQGGRTAGTDGMTEQTRS